MDIDPQAKWLFEAIAASKEAKSYALASYPVVEVAALDRGEQHRALEFHENESGPDADVMSAILDAMKWHIPPEEFRAYAQFAEIQRLLRQIDELKAKASDEEQRRRALEVALMSSHLAGAVDEDDDDYRDEPDDAYRGGIPL